jgi:hypothetical protein
MDKKRRNEFLKSVEEGPQSFQSALDAYFPAAGTQAIIKGAFKRVGLPLPQTTAEFMPGTDGLLLFSNIYGLVIRIEQTEKKPVQPSQWVLQPLGAFDAIDAVVEFCPACRFEDDKANYHLVKAALKEEGINFWDTGLRNMGRLPITTAQFPDGVPVVVDRRAVKMLTDDIKPVSLGLQGRHYGPLRCAFTHAASAKRGSSRFLSRCEKFVAEGKLVPGWNDYRPLVDNKWEGDKAKGLIAGHKAAAYDALIMQEREQKQALRRMPAARK